MAQRISGRNFLLAINDRHADLKSKCHEEGLCALFKKKQNPNLIAARQRALNNCFLVVAGEDDFSEDRLLGKPLKVFFFPQRQSP